MRRAMTTISKRLWIEGTVRQLQAKLVTSSLVRTFPGPSGYEVKSQGASLEATCKHVEVAKSVSPSPHLLTGMDFNITETPTKAKGTMRLIAPYPHAQVMRRLGISQSRFIKRSVYKNTIIQRSGYRKYLPYAQT